MADIIFMGTPDFAVPTLQALIKNHRVIGVVTQPDRPAGRNRQLQPSPIKQTALAAGIPVFQPEKLRKPEAIEELRQLGTPDVYIVAAFGQILPQSVLDIPPHGSVNVHASLLPRWRGAAPIQAVIRAGDAQTGITIMQMDAGLDTGPMLSQRAIPIAPDETSQSLHDKLALLGAELLTETLPRFLAGEITPQPQDDAHSTLAPRITKDEGRINWNTDAASIERAVRAFTPWPGTFTFWGDRQLKILSGSTGTDSAAPGKVVKNANGIAIGTGDGLVYPMRLQLAGGKPVTIDEFVNGHADFIGAQLT
ncbi:MAG: methionyl-tRNA formyltransferase [Burkholderiales bacterium]|nr:methionyl-tRNA formyltransferase [Anaerolineae bacterium]